MIKKILLPSLLAGFFIVIFSIHSLYRHFSFNSHAFDLGIYTQTTYLYSQGLTPFSTLKHMILLADHFEPILFLISPIYKLFPAASTLLVLQAIFVALSSIPIYSIAIDKLKNKTISFLITLSYLTSVGILSGINFDFHTTTISVLPLSLALYCWYFKKWKLYWIVLLLSLTFKEDIPLFILGLGVYQVFQKEIKIGLSTIIFALIGFYTIKFQIMPFLWQGGNLTYLSTSNLPLSSPIDLFLLFITRPSIFTDQIFNSPIKIQTINEIYHQFAFLPALSLFGWLTIFPSLFFRFSSSYTQTWTNTWHHSANLAPFLAVSTILALNRFKIPFFPISILLIFFLVTGGLAPNGMVLSTIRSPFRDFSRFQYIEQSLKDIPPSAAVSAQSPLVPHLINRTEIYMFPEVYGAEYVILDASLSSYPLRQEELKDKIDSFRKSKYWQIKTENKGLIIFQKRIY